MVTIFKRSIRARYIFALLLIAFFSTMAFFNLYSIIKTQANDGEIINISGKQRMLSQRIALLAMQKKYDTLLQTAKQMERSHRKLITIAMTNEVYSLYYEKPYELDFFVKEYLENVKKYVKTKEQRYLQYILEHSEGLLKKLDKVVSVYQKEAEEKIEKLQENELYIFLLTIITLLFEALFIFYPLERDIRKKTKALINEKEFANLVTQTNTNAIIAVDQNYKILTYNASAQKMFGYTKEEMINTTILDDRIIPQKYLQRHIDGLRYFMENGKLKSKQVTFELEAKRKDGEEFPIRISFGVSINKNKKLVVANIQDITEEKQKDSIIIQQSRLAAMGEMIGNIAHQWRQPLSAISTLSSGAKLRYKNDLLSDDELYEAFDKIKEHTKYLSQTIDDFRSFFSKEQQKTLFDINETIQKSLSLVEASYKNAHIDIYQELSKYPITVIGSSSKLSQIILNILNNAKDILVEKNIEPKKVYITSFIKEDQAVIEIIDNGGGIPEDIAMKIFEPYFTTKHKAQGTGIGLFMSSEIIKQHFQGELYSNNVDFEIDGTKYHGAKFTIKLHLEL